MHKKSTELLAPAGDAAAFEAALAAGADAIYLGLQDFSARKSAANFTLESLPSYIRRAHALGVQIYVALNTLVKEGERQNFFESALQAWNAGADALIVQDLFLGNELKRCYPAMELHLSTQAGVCNAEGALLAKEFGFSRVILARETLSADVKRIAQILETECFVQGALCTCFSGQCYFSSVVGGNSGNRGLCKQPCRKRYSIDRTGFDKPAYRLSLADLSMGKSVEDLRRLGVYSFKIEGRMRSAAYVWAAVRYYRDLLDGEAAREAEDLSALRRTFNRGNYTKGYLFGQDRALITSDIQGHIGEAVGEIVKKDKSGRYVFVRSALAVRDQDGFKIIRGEKQEIGGVLWRSSYPSAKGGFYLPYHESYREGDTVCLTSDHALAERVQTMHRTIDIELSVWMEAGRPLRASAKGGFGEFVAESETVAEPSRNRPISEQDLKECFAKVDSFPFRIRFAQVSADGKSFIVRSQLNAFRRQVLSGIYERLGAIHPPLQKKEMPVLAACPATSASGKIAVIDRDFSAPCYREQQLDYAILDPENIQDTTLALKFLEDAKYCARHKYIYFPAYCTGEDMLLYEKLLPYFDGVYADGYYALYFCRSKGIPVFAGTGLNLFNRADAMGALEAGVRELALSKELSLTEIKEIGVPSAFVFAGGRTRMMDLGHCPFAKTCATCDRRRQYHLQDEEGRSFPLLRSERSVCRFSVYNCVPLRVACGGNRLFDLSASPIEEKQRILTGQDGGTFTAGASKKGVS